MSVLQAWKTLHISSQERIDNKVYVIIIWPGPELNAGSVDVS